MNPKGEGFKVGDTVRVKKGVKEPDFEEYNLDDWQGEIVELESEDLVTIEWDLETLSKASMEYLMMLNIEGYEYERLTLADSEVIKTEKRKASESLRKEAMSRIQYVEIFGGDAEDYMEVFKGVDFYNEFEMYERWREHLSKNLKFPFDTEVTEYQERGIVQSGDSIKLEKIEAYEGGLHGLLVKGKYKEQTIIFQLCDLAATDTESDNYSLLHDYCIWFANR